MPGELPESGSRPEPQASEPSAGPTAPRQPPGAAGQLHLSPGDVVNGAWRGGWDMFRADSVSLPLAAAAAWVLGSLSIGILMGALIWGLQASIFARLRYQRPMSVGDIFGRFERFGTSLGIVFLGGLLTVIGLALLVVPGLYLMVAFMYALPLGLERRLGAVDSLKESRRIVHATGFGAHAALMATLLAFGWLASALLDWVGGLISFIVGVPVLTAAYERFVRGNPGPGADYEI